MTTNSDWIASTGLRPVHADMADAVIPDHVLANPDLSLTAKGLLAVLIAQQGQPVNPYEDAYESETDLRAAVAELIAAGLVVKVAAPT